MNYPFCPDKLPFMSAEQIEALNQIIQMIDKQSNKYKNEVMKMPQFKRTAEKKLLLDLIQNGIKLANDIKPKPLDAVTDLKRLGEQIERLG